MIVIITGQVQKLYIYPDKIDLTIKSRIPAQQIKCWIDGVIAIGVFTVVKVEKGDTVKIIATVNTDGTYTAHTLLNFSNYLLHMHPFHGNSMKQMFAEIIQLGGIGGLLAIVLFSLFFSISHYNIYHEISLQPFYSAVMVGFWGAIGFFIIGILAVLPTIKYAIQTRQIFEILEFPQPAQLSMFKNINQKNYKIQWLQLSCCYQENKKRFAGVYDLREVFGTEVEPITKPHQS